MLTQRTEAAAALVDGLIYVFGGELGRPTTYAENEGYDAAADLWVTKAPLPTARHGLAAVTAGGRIFVISGGPRSDVIIVWSFVRPVLAPPGRHCAAHRRRR